MRTRTWWSFAAASVILLGTVGLLSAQATRPGDTIETWEYHTEAIRSAASPSGDQRADARRPGGSSSDAILNSWGRNGWELVAVTRREVRVDDTLETETFYAFKRPMRPVNR